MRAQDATALSVIVKRRFLLVLTTAVGVFCFAAAPAFGQTTSLTTQPTDQTLYSANLIASITTSSDSTDIWFQWGVDTNYGHSTPATIVQNASGLTVSNLIADLAPYTVYHCQAVASNVLGTVYGGDVSFTTVPKFVQVGTNTDWTALVLSGDGRELAGTIGGTVYISTNLGLNFLPTSGMGDVFAISSNGVVIVAASGSSIYASLDRGVTWTSNSAPAAFRCFAASSDAQKLVATAGGGSVYTSTDFGATWSRHTVPYAPTYGLASSADGTHLYGSTFPYRNTAAIYGSTSSGGTWTSLGTFAALISAGGIACSADGAIVAVADEAFFKSTNGGASWSYYGQPTGGTIACSSDGQTIIIYAIYGIAVSPDTGNTWYQANPVFLQFGSVLASADGRTLAAFNGGIFISLPPPSKSSALSNTTSAVNGLPTFQLTGQPGYSYTIQASTDLVDWMDIASVVNTNGIVPFVDQAATNFQHRFYRAVAPY